MAARLVFEVPPPRWGVLLLGAALFATGCATLAPPSGQEDAYGSGADVAMTCGGQAVPEGWPGASSSDEELLAPFLACSSPAEFIELQRGVDMPLLVEALGDWSAVRPGTLGRCRSAGSASSTRASHSSLGTWIR